MIVKRIILLISISVCMLILFSCVGLCPFCRLKYRLKETNEETMVIDMPGYTLKIETGYTHHSPIIVDINIESNKELIFFPENLEIIYNKRNLIYTQRAAPGTKIQINRPEMEFRYSVYWQDNNVAIVDGSEFQIFARDILCDGQDCLTIDTLAFLVEH